MAKNTISAGNVTLASDIFRCGFTAATTHPNVSEDFDVVSTAAGQTVLQTGGNLLFTTGVTPNEQTMLRTKRSFVGSHAARWKCILSQRIANNNFVIELADKIADMVPFSNPTSTSVVVNIPIGIFNSDSIGQTISIANIRNVAGVPGDAVIAAVTDAPELGISAITLTVAGWPGIGEIGTCLLYGWNCYRAVYDGTTATNVKWECRRRGYNATFTAFTNTTSAAPGHVAEWKTDGQTATFSDTSATMATTTALSLRAVRMENLPDDDTTYHLWMSVSNGTVAPATTTTWTVGFAAVEQVGNNKVQALAPVTAATSSLGVVTVTQSTGSALNAQVTGAAAQGSTASGNPVFTAGVAKTAMPTARTDGQVVAPMYDKIGRFVGAYEQTRDLTTMSGMITLTATTETTITGAVASVFNDLKACIITNTSATAVRVDFRTTTAGTVVFSIMAEAGKTQIIAFPHFAKQATVNTNWTAQLSAAVTDVRITNFVIQAN